MIITRLTNLLFNNSVEEARSVMYETELGVFSAFLTNNQARRLSSELNPNKSTVYRYTS
jgi:predicted transcriptional regulator